MHYLANADRASAFMTRQAQLRTAIILFSGTVAVILTASSWWQIFYSPSALVPRAQNPEFVADSNGITLHSKAVSSMNFSEVVPPYHHFGSLYFTAPRYQLATCAIQKNMATIQWTVFCFLKDPARFIASNRTITSSKKWDASLCSTDHYRPSLPQTMEALGPNMTLFTVIRHPIDRFLSGYTDRCLLSVHLMFTPEKPLNCPTQYHHTVHSTTNLPKFSHVGMGALHHRPEKNFRNTRFKEDERCFGCRSDIRCFVEKLHKTLIDYYHDSADTSYAVRHLVSHFAPQTWFCEFEKYRKNYILINYHMGTNGAKRIAEELDAVLAKAHVEPEFREIIIREISSGRTPHSTRNTEVRREVDRKLLSDAYLMKHIMEMYFYDFTNLGFV